MLYSFGVYLAHFAVGAKVSADLTMNFEQFSSNLIASLLLVAMPFAPSSFLLLVVRPGAPSSILAPTNSDGFQPKSNFPFLLSLFLLAMASTLVAMACNL